MNLKKLSISLLAAFAFTQAGAQVDTSDVVVATYEAYFPWKGVFNSNNDTTRMLLKAIREYGPIADSVIARKQREHRVRFSGDLVRQFKADYFGLITFSQLADASDRVLIDASTKALEQLLDQNNTSTLVQNYLAGTSRRDELVRKYVSLNVNRSSGASYDPTSPGWSSRLEQRFQDLGAATMKRVIVVCPAGRRIFINSQEAGEGRVEWALPKGRTHLIEIKTSTNQVACKQDLELPSSSSNAPLTINCNGSSPCNCSSN